VTSILATLPLRFNKGLLIGGSKSCDEQQQYLTYRGMYLDVLLHSMETTDAGWARYSKAYFVELSMQVGEDAAKCSILLEGNSTIER
jgi:hypothetical protein